MRDDPRLAVGQVLEREVRGVAAGAVHHRVLGEGLNGLEEHVQRHTPKLVPSFDHFVTQWMSQGTSSNGSSPNSVDVQLCGSATIPSI